MHKKPVSSKKKTILMEIAKRISKKFANICVENSLEFFREKVN